MLSKQFVTISQTLAVWESILFESSPVVQFSVYRLPILLDIFTALVCSQEALLLNFSWEFVNAGLEFDPTYLVTHVMHDTLVPTDMYMPLRVSLVWG